MKNSKKIFSCLLTALCCQTVFSAVPAFEPKENNPRAEARELRYVPNGEDFVFQGNTPMLFNRALYGENQAFRLETGDLPIFAFYAPTGMAGHLEWGLVSGDRTLWLHQADSIRCIYRPGYRIYEITDPILKGGSICLTALCRYDCQGAVFRFEAKNTPKNLQWVCVYGGAYGKKFSRNGDMGADRPDVFYLKPEYCRNNRYFIHKENFELAYGATIDVDSYFAEDLHNPQLKVNFMNGQFPKKSKLQVGDVATCRGSLRQVLDGKPDTDCPILVAKGRLTAGKSRLMGFTYGSDPADLAQGWQHAADSIAALQQRLQVYTPDPFVNAMAPALVMAADGIWQSPVYQHGAIGWRTALAGWRGAYTGDVLGWHDRAREHFRAYAASQMTSPSDKPVIMDTLLHQARSAKVAGTPMYSEGYIARHPNDPKVMNHYDMNIAYIDELLWHLNWTGDLDFAREIWPVLQRHLAWEKRCFDADGDGLYDAYCCIWASDALQYSSGGVTHSSAYVLRANRMAAEIARLLGEDPAPYDTEADRIDRAIREKLWMDSEGHWAEYQDFLGDKLLHPDAGLWTVYHAIDSEVGDGFDAYQATRYVDTRIPHIPVRVTDPKGYKIESDLHTLSSTDWMPYIWSVNNVAFGEVMHTVLAYCQADREEEAYRLLKATLLDGMYLGGSPGNVGQVSFYDASRGESYRDFADPIGVYARALVQGFFGIQPDLMHDRVLLKPCLPQDWDSASIAVSELAYSVSKNREYGQSWTIVPSFAKDVTIELSVPVYKSDVSDVQINGKSVDYRLDSAAIDHPRLLVTCRGAERYTVDVYEDYKPLPACLHLEEAVAGEPFRLQIPQGLNVGDLYDPQGVVASCRRLHGEWQIVFRERSGWHTFFLPCRSGSLFWWQAVDVDIRPLIGFFPHENQGDASSLSFDICNNSGQNRTVSLRLNRQTMEESMLLPAHSRSACTTDKGLRFGTNRLEVVSEAGTEIHRIVRWDPAFDSSRPQRCIPLDAYFNDSLNGIFAYGKYLSPRSPYTTLQLPTQGFGDWCGPNALPHIDDSGLRRAAGHDNQIHSPQGIRFLTPSDKSLPNAVFVSQWDNYPTRTDIPLSGRASHAFLLMAGTTNHMQSHLTNGRVTVVYADGTCDSLELVNPDSWVPIEQDYYDDGMAFRLSQPRPWRLHLKDGQFTRQASNGKMIDGGAATLLDLPLDPSKELVRLQLEAVTIESVIGLLSLTLVE